MKMIVVFLSLTALWLSFVMPNQAAGATKPNVIIIFTDDQGFADLGCQGSVKDIRTPNLDRIAREGVRCTAGYVTAPQCSPSRAGLLTGRYQERFGFDRIGHGPLPLEEETLATRLQKAGYVTGMVGKWHLDPSSWDTEWVQKNFPDVKLTKQVDAYGRALTAKGDPVVIPPEMIAPYYPGARGFADFFYGFMAPYLVNYDVNGKSLKPEGQWIKSTAFRIDIQSDAACAFIRRHQTQSGHASDGATPPFFLYLAYAAPHVPLEAPEKYLNRFPGTMPQRRRVALAMLSAIDDGVGRILDMLAELKIDENTLIIFCSDNGAPLYVNKADKPIIPGLAWDASWDGSLNDPWLGEKGMLTEGGIREPFLLRFKGVLPAGKVYDEPISTLDIVPTVLALAGQPKAADLDGVNLLPYLTGQQAETPHEYLYWRFFSQEAVRAGQWKYLRLSDGTEYLFDLSTPAQESKNVLAAHVDIAARLKERLAGWAQEMKPSGLLHGPIQPGEVEWYSGHEIGQH